MKSLNKKEKNKIYSSIIELMCNLSIEEEYIRKEHIKKFVSMIITTQLYGFMVSPNVYDIPDKNQYSIRVKCSNRRINILFLNNLKEIKKILIKRNSL